MKGSRTHTHPVDVGYLVMGLVFLGLAGLWGLREAELVALPELQWLLPVSLIAAGAIGLLAAAAKSHARRRASTGPDPSYGTYDDTDRPYDTSGLDNEHGERTQP